ncbi:SNF2 family N-terminal domain-containing protein [Polychytrium aggregatum]|uniref:SNF2 family N-terminal domain-containing protein n=1 Tax=Polychytrium aggregatum TaxID=110093 RepID=UPI0022FEAB4B|nr:SNF2 family N-terminal domain-containing protein [Polychytrium aggregatum]KAI9206275.1 SNF2 family N-terminal domain-containing protein [Polychytrium aggregatum]
MQSHPQQTVPADPLAPLGVSQEYIRSIIVAAQKMKDQGATEQANPEFANLLNILRYYQKASKTVKAQYTQQRLPQTHPSASVPAPDQADQLKNQINAFRHLAANQVPPEHLKNAVMYPDSSDPSAEAAPNAAITRRIVETAYHQPTTALQGPLAPGLALSETAVAGSSLPSTLPLSIKQRALVPPVVPIGIDYLELQHEREARIRGRVQNRIRELESLPSNLSNEAIASLESVDPHTSLKLKALIELKALKLLDKQREVREKLVQGMVRGTTLTTSVDRSAYRRMKKQTLREARQTEKQERQQRLEREKKEREDQSRALYVMMGHGREMLEFHQQQQKKLGRLGVLVGKLHVNIEKEEQKRIQRVSQERLKALKEDNEEKYLELLDREKNERISYLLTQTNGYLDSLTQAVRSQQEAITNESVPDMDDGELDDSSKMDYYKTAHRIDEIVTAQPTILVGGKLKEYQLKGLQWMISLYNNRLNGILADEMGLGKTIQTISLITYLIEKKKQNGPFLVIVPLSTITNWNLEFEKWAPSVGKICFKGGPQERKRLAMEVRAGNFNVLLTTYEYIIRDRIILSKIKWVHMIIDEGHRMKNTSSRLSVTLMQYYVSRYRLILTGTPLQNNLPELWALLNFVLPKIFNSVKTFDEWFNSPFSTAAGSGQDKIELNEEEQLLIIRRLHKVLRPFLLRRLKKDVESELPDKVENVIKCKLSALQSRLYEQVRSRKTLYTEPSSKVSGGTRALNNIVMQFRKICNHPYVFPEVEELMNPSQYTDNNIWRVSGKFELLDRILPKYKRTGHRVLIFFQMTAIMNIMEDFLNFRGWKYMRLDGSIKADDRSDLLKKFNAPDSEYFIFLLSTRAGGLGLNLQTADTVVIFDSDWNPHQDLQAQDRAHRIGQTKEVRILRLITSKSIEENILARAQYKLDLDGKVIQAGKFDNKTSENEREELLRSLFGGDEDEDDKDETDEADIGDDELNEIIARSPDEVELFKKMDEEREINARRDWAEAGRSGPPPPRLMPDEELPAVYLMDPTDLTEKEAEMVGRGARARKEVRYDDGLNEEQWLNAIDAGEDVEELIQKKEDARRRREEKKRREDDDGDDTADPADAADAADAADDSSVAETKTPKRSRHKGRKSVVVDEELDETPTDSPRSAGRRKGGSSHSKSRSALFDEVEESTPKRKKRKKDITGIDYDEVDPIPANKRKAMTALFMRCYEAVEGCEYELDGYGTVQRSALFLELPSRSHYPDYYKIISQPIAMDIIKARIHSTYYKLPHDFVDDFKLMFNNARTYNQEGSQVYTDASEMEAVFDSTYAAQVSAGILDVPDVPSQDTATAPSIDDDGDESEGVAPSRSSKKSSKHRRSSQEPSANRASDLPKFKIRAVTRDHDSTPHSKRKRASDDDDDEDDDGEIYE